MMNFEFTGYIASVSIINNVGHVIMTDVEGKHRLFEANYMITNDFLGDTYDEEKHLRYDLGMDTRIILTINDFSQSVISWRWLVEREAA